MSKAASTPKHKPAGKQGGKPAPKPAPTKSAPKRKPLLPQHELPAPYSRLLTMGDVEVERAEPLYQEIAATLLKGNAQEAVARLTGIALDVSYEDYFNPSHPDDDDPRLWTRLHALGVLSAMGQPAHAAIEPLLPLLEEEDDDLREEMPIFYAAMGEAAVDSLRRVLQNPDADTYMRAGAGDCLTQIGENHAELRPTIVPLLEQSLMSSGEDDVLASFLVCNLLDLSAKESLPYIRQAFEEKRVDESVVEMRDVEEHFGLAPISPARMALRGQMLDMDEAEGAGEFAPDGNGAANVSASEGMSDGSVAAPTPCVKPVKLGRNEPCWCGSGKKFKQCHGG